MLLNLNPTTVPSPPSELTLSAGQSVWGWWDASLYSPTQPNVYNAQLSNVLWPAQINQSPYYYWIFNTIPTITSLNSVPCISLTNNHATLTGGLDPALPVLTTIASKLPADAPSTSWEIFVVGRFSGTGTIFSQSISSTTTARQMQLFKNPAAADVGGYLVDSFNRGIGASALDNKDLNSAGNSPSIAYMLLDNTPLAGSNPKVDLGSGPNVARRGNLVGTFAALEASPHIRIGARGNGSNNSVAFTFSDATAAFAELVIFSHSAGTAPLSPENRLSLRKYLANKWGAVEAAP